MAAWTPRNHNGDVNELTDVLKEMAEVAGNMARHLNWLFESDVPAGLGRVLEFEGEDKSQAVAVHRAATALLLSAIEATGTASAELSTMRFRILDDVINRTIELRAAKPRGLTVN